MVTIFTSEIAIRDFSVNPVNAERQTTTIPVRVQCSKQTFYPSQKFLQRELLSLNDDDAHQNNMNRLISHYYVKNS